MQKEDIQDEPDIYGNFGKDLLSHFREPPSIIKFILNELKVPASIFSRNDRYSHKNNANNIVIFF